MNYRIVGADGKVYGPIGLEQIRRWLAEGRVESRTPVYVEGAGAWTTLALLPELAAEVAGAPPAIGAVSTTPPSSRGTNGYATAGLVCSLLSWTCCCCLPFNLLGIIFSIIALTQINSQPQPQQGRILAIIGLVLSGANLLFTIAVMVFQMAFGNNIDWPAGQFGG
jgi:hypothetical protein